MSKKRWRGAILIYSICAMVVFTGFVSLGVDLARAQKAKTELQIAADAAARNAASALILTSFSTTNAKTAAKLTAKVNVADGTPVILTDSDIVFGTWDTSAHTFTPVSSTNPVSPNAARVTAYRTTARGNAIPLLFGGIFGHKNVDVSGVSTAVQIPFSINQNFPGTANPFLSGMAPGSKASQTNPSSRKIPDVAGPSTANPGNSPVVVGLPISEGSAITFDAISGTVRHDPNLSDYEPDGQLDDVGHNNTTTDYNNNYTSSYTNENGIADMRSPINALVGVFLDDNAPNTTSAPANLDFSTPASRDFTSLSPQLKQIFFIGDGLDSSGNHQQFIPPKGATRLFLATWDFYEWNNNSGTRNVKVNRPPVIKTVE